MSSDEEHFSPPVYVKAKPGNIESKRRSISVSSAEWLSDGVKPLASDTTQDTPLHSPSQGLALNPADIQAAEVFPTSSDHVTERLSLSSQSDQLKCEVNREKDGVT
ncbi:hypothetical protein EB796_016347 [Bugula neritina]|uniref:Uncharacterized protein n=1 Tax=Bugula neritina TaxID=10212 RepID=A0A7J7JJ02_BUGNE|nr:hypothetical protein EB796_016347 [Bugula neritina]